MGAPREITRKFVRKRDMRKDLKNGLRFESFVAAKVEGIKTVLIATTSTQFQVHSRELFRVFT